MALDIDTLTFFVKATQLVSWQRLEKQSDGNADRKFYKAFENAVENDELISVASISVFAILSRDQLPRKNVTVK